MAFQFPKIDLTDAKTRVLIIVGGVLSFIAVIYFGMQFFASKKTASGPSQVASAPGNLQSVPGGQLTPEYYRALVQANAQAAKQAKLSGGSAVPTLLNEPGIQPSLQQPTTSGCTVVCPTEDNANVENDINDLVKSGKLSAEDGKVLSELAKKNVAVSEYSAQLNQLVKAGKLTPEQARKLLDSYKKQHESSLLQESGAAMDSLIKAGQLPVDAANELLDMQKKHASTADYAAKLSELVKEGKISPQVAAQLLAQYTQQQAKEAAAEALGQLAQMAASGQITPEVAAELADYQRRHVPVKEYEEELQHLVKQGKLTPEQAQRLLAQYRQQLSPEVADELAGFQKRNVPIAEYQAELQKLVAAGKITPEQAQQLLDQYRQIKSAGTPPGALEDIVKQNEKANEDAIKQLAESGRISPDTAKQLLEMQRTNVPIDEYKRQLDEMVRDGKLSPEDAQKLLISYMQQKGAGVQDLLTSGKISSETAQKLMELQRVNVPIEEYKRQLDQLVREGKISPQDAQRLLNSYAEMKGATGVQGMLASGRITQETADKLTALERAKVPVEEYKKQLDELVRAGKISPDDAQKLLISYMQQKGGGVQDLLASGKIARQTADKLLALQKQNVPVDEYKRQLDQMVREGRISAADAGRLLNNYEQMRGAGVQDLLAAGKISADTAQKLMDLQRSNVPMDAYKQQLDQMVKEGKISAEDAQKLLTNYQQMKGAGVRDLLAEGKISPETAQKLLDLQHGNASAEEYKKQLDDLVKAGKISAEDAEKLLNNYQQMRGGGTVENLVSTPKISPEVEQKLLDMQRANVPPADYKRQLDELVREGKISPQEAQRLLATYEKLHAVRAEADKLTSMRASNVPVEEYANELKRAVAAGTISPEQATRLLQEYRTAQAQAAIPVANIPTNVQGGQELADLQKRIQSAEPTNVAPAGPISAAAPPHTEQFNAAAKKAKALAEQQEQQRVQALMNAMSQQAAQLISSWQPPVMAGQVGGESEKDTKTKATGKAAATGAGAGAGSSTASGGEAAAPASAPLIKAGTIIYAVLDTGVNSDFPDSPVLATIVDGPFKGAKLLGKLALTEGQDRISLTFKLMNMEDWTSGKTVNAFAVDPDTARTVLASSVNHHYFMRYGSLLASSFITGYAGAISSSGATTSLSVTGSTTTNPVLSPADKLVAGLGQVGKTFGTAVQGYVNTPATVKIDPGVSLGILFMADVS